MFLLYDITEKSLDSDMPGMRMHVNQWIPLEIHFKIISRENESLNGIITSKFSFNNF